MLHAFPLCLRGLFNFDFQRTDATMPYSPGYEEDGILKSLKINISDIEPLADGCTKVLFVLV